MAESKDYFDHALKRQERIAATFRVAIVAALGLAALGLKSDSPTRDPLLAMVALYGILAAVGMGFALRRVPSALPFFFAAAEVLLIVVHSALFVLGSGLPSEMIFGLPTTTLVFVVLAHTSVRYRPSLIASVAGVHILAVSVAWYILQGMNGHGSSIDGPQHDHQMMQFLVMPLLILVLTAGILFVANREALGLLRNASKENVRVALLSRFFSDAVAKQISNENIGPLDNGRRQPVVVQFIDIREFTSISQDMEPEQVGQLLSEFRTVITPIIQKYNGDIDKFIGDAALVVFGYPHRGLQTATDALRCSEEITNALEEWSRRRKANGAKAVSVGIGLHYGVAFVGVIGREDMLEFTVVGDVVNVAERLERLTRALNASIVVSDTFAAQLPRKPDAPWRLETGQPIPGRTGAIDVWHLAASQ